MTAPPGKRKVWLFRLISLVLIPIVFFGFLELALRCFGYGYSPHAIVKHRLEDKDVYCQNYKFGWRFFPRTTARYFDGFVFDTHKSPKTYRIFVLGASAALGIPAPAYNFGRMLEVMLDERYPDTNFEVHTVAMAAINSYAVLEIAKDCAEYEPDLFIVYLGNNEVVGPFGPGTVFAPLSPSLSLIRANIAFKATRTGQLLEQITQSIGPRKMPQQWTGMEMFLDKQVRYNDPALQIAYRHFEKNLQDICRVGLNAGAAVIVSNVPSNLKDSPPFASLHRKDLTDTEKQAWEQCYDKGVAFETEGRYEQAMAQYREAEKIDAEFADLEYRLGTCFWNTGDYKTAKEKYTAAREYDTLRFRADNRVNEIIRKVATDAQKKNLYFADSIGVFEANSPHHIPGAALFYEHVHMKFDGNYLVARSILPHIQKILAGRQPAQTADVLSVEEVANVLAYTVFERVVYLKLMHETFLNVPPFTNQLFHEQRMANIQNQIGGLMRNLQKVGLNPINLQHQRAIQNRPDDWQLLFQYAGFLNSGMHDIEAEEVQIRKVLKRCPYHSAYLTLGINLQRQGRINEAQAVLNDLIELNPNEIQAYDELASIDALHRDYANQIQHLLKALALDSGFSVRLYINLADAYNMTGKPDRAMQTLNEALKQFPEEQTAPVHTFLAYLLSAQGNDQKALQEMRHAMKIDPDIRKNDSYNTFLTNLESRVQ